MKIAESFMRRNCRSMLNFTDIDGKTFYSLLPGSERQSYNKFLRGGRADGNVLQDAAVSMLASHFVQNRLKKSPVPGKNFVTIPTGTMSYRGDIDRIIVLDPLSCACPQWWCQVKTITDIKILLDVDKLYKKFSGATKQLPFSRFYCRFRPTVLFQVESDKPIDLIESKLILTLQSTICKWVRKYPKNCWYEVYIIVWPVELSALHTKLCYILSAYE